MPLETIKQCIDKKKCFVLQGGAGSGKTETLKEVLEHISEKYPDKKVACITHTNLAVDEIKSRVGDKYVISTIHSFLNSIIKDYKKNIFQCIFELFKLDRIERCDLAFYANDEKEQNKQEHEKYKKIHKKFAAKLFTIKNKRIDKVEGKKEYDKTPDVYNALLNIQIDELNSYMQEQISTKDYNKIKYNETRFDSYNDLTYGHDGLINIAYQLFVTYPKIGKILTNKFDFILIDEYQDTHENIIEIFLKFLPPANSKTIIGLFGDSMQAIYADGIGDVEKYIKDGYLIKVLKEDNYRCSEQVIEFINTLRNDGLVQKVALKHIELDLNERQGNVHFYYSVIDNKPHTKSPEDEKKQYLNSLNKLIEYATTQQPDSKLLMLTNKSISKEAGFFNLYDVFAQRYQDPKEYIDDVLIKLQFIDLIELCIAYQNRNFNFILSELKKISYHINTANGKAILNDHIQSIINSTCSAINTLEQAFSNKLIKKVEKYDEYIIRKNDFLRDVYTEEFNNFKEKYIDGNKIFSKMKTVIKSIEEEQFLELEKILKKELFYTGLFSETISFQEVLNYYKYMMEQLDYVTMHKTKGSSIENVIVVLDEYFWNEYDFTKVFDSTIVDTKKLNSQKLFYVACSRTEKNLTCVKLITEDEEAKIKIFFPTAQKIAIV